MYYKLKVRVWVRVRYFVRSGHVQVRVRGFISESSYDIMSFFNDLSWPLLTPDDPLIILTSVNLSWPQKTLYIIFYTCFPDSLDNQLLLGDIVELQPAMQKVSFHSMADNDGHFSRFLIFETFQIFGILKFWYFAPGKARL